MILLRLFFPHTFFVASWALALGLIVSSAASSEDLPMRVTSSLVSAPSSTVISEQSPAVPASDIKESSNKPFHAALPEGQTLPAGIARFRFVQKSIHGQTGFDGGGQVQNLGFSIRAQVSALVAEYGWTDRLSLQILLPYVGRNEAGLDATSFRASSLYKSKYEAARKQVISHLDGKICVGYEQCSELIESGYNIPYDTLLTHPDTGETFLIQNKFSLATQLDSLIMNQAAPSTGMSGLGDLEIGALYNFVRYENFSLSSGLGLRAPTGKFEDVPLAFRPTGAGLWDLGVRVNLDYQPVYGLWLSFIEQNELALTKAKRRQTSLLDNRQLVEDETATRYEQKGFRRKGTLQASHGLGVWGDGLKPFVLSGAYHYRHDRVEYKDHVPSAPARLTLYSLGLSVDGRAYKLPFGFDLNYEAPLSGKNAFVAPYSITATIKTFAKF
ncbi:MAG: hypothetical protein KA436_10450 [Oligoflexales bacterium]|nr:hypothetical protein [Oligoflexales bacterium]